MSFALTFLLSASSTVVLAGGVETPNPWMVYVGAYGGYYTADYSYRNCTNNSSATSTTTNGS